MRMSVEEYGRAIQSAYVEGYIQGASHPPKMRVMVKAKELAALFWRCCEQRIDASSRPPRAALGDTSR